MTTICQLLNEVDHDAVWYQNLDDAMTGYRQLKSGETIISFSTDQKAGIDGTEKLGILVWVDRDEASRVLRGGIPNTTLTLAELRSSGLHYIDGRWQLFDESGAHLRDVESILDGLYHAAVYNETQLHGRLIPNPENPHADT